MIRVADQHIIVACQVEKIIICSQLGIDHTDDRLRTVKRDSGQHTEHRDTPHNAACQVRQPARSVDGKKPADAAAPFAKQTELAAVTLVPSANVAPNALYRTDFPHLDGGNQRGQHDSKYAESCYKKEIVDIDGERHGDIIEPSRLKNLYQRVEVRLKQQQSDLDDAHTEQYACRQRGSQQNGGFVIDAEPLLPSCRPHGRQ